MRAIILAAGKGERLKPYTSDRPKCLVELAGRTLLAHQVEALDAAGINDIWIVTGYQADQVRSLGYPTRHNARYETTNMVASLMCAADLLDGRDDVLIAYSDIVYEPRIVEALCACNAPICITVDRSWRKLWQVRMEDPLADAETLKLSEAGDIVELGKKPHSYADIQGQYMGLTKVRADAAPKLVDVYRRLSQGFSGKTPDPARMYMTDFLQYLIDHGQAVRAVPVDGGWLEIDSQTDLERFNQMHELGQLDDCCQLMMLETCMA